MTNTPRPIVRSLVACELIRPDTEKPKQLTLIRVVNSVRPLPGQGYPVIRPDFSVFALVTDGRGSGEVWIELRHADSDRTIYHSRRLRVRFPTDPLQLCGMSFELHNVAFPTPGLYWVQLWFDGELLADLPILFR
jgi:hypothetical protein